MPFPRNVQRSQTSAAARLPLALGETPSAPAISLIESYERLADVFHDVLSEQSLDSLLERIADTVAELIPHDDLALYEADEAELQLRCVFARGQYADEVLADRPFRFGEGITGWAAEHRTPVLANRADLDPRVRFVTGTPPDPESLVAVPLIARGRLRGALNIYRSGLVEFTEEEFRLAVRFGDAAALALDNAHVRARLELQAQTDSLTGLWNHRAFHERLRRELLHASSTHGTVALLMLDLDDFKRVNDVYGHALGDRVLTELAAQLRGAVRQRDDVCRIGGEEFAVIVRGDLRAATELARRLAGRLAAAHLEPVGPVNASIGIAIGPDHAANPRELVACAEIAMMTAKARGKNRVVVFDEEESERPVAAPRTDVRSIAHLKMLHGVSAKLSRLADVTEIGATIAGELRELIDYHNCRLFIRRGDELEPIAFRGELSMDAGSALQALATRVGIGITGHVAQHGEPFVTGDAANCGLGQHIEGTARIEESLLAVPLRYGPDVVGVIVISKLGRDQFDGDDLRLLEVVAGHASVALVNSQLYEARRREAESATALLELSRELSVLTTLEEVADRVVQRSARILGCPQASLWLPDETGELVCRSAWAAEGRPVRARRGDRLPVAAALAFAARDEPFVVRREEYEGLVGPAFREGGAAAYAVAPLVLDPGWGALALALPGPAALDTRMDELLRGIAAQAKLALVNARSFETLQRTFLETVEALANALEAKDEYTSSHARSIADMAVDVGEALGLRESELERLGLAALLHDIGKIGIPASILAKPGPLTEEERAVIETHPELGEHILAPVEHLRDVRPIVRACHERFDGAGYPDGLRGTAIPLAARIILVCDAFHAMTTNRPYRRALPLAEARRRLREGAGSQFDPDVVEVCLRTLCRPE